MNFKPLNHKERREFAQGEMVRVWDEDKRMVGPYIVVGWHGEVLEKRIYVLK